ncbi:hypothetical protein [Microbacterium resistens]|uniref:hypothetical protein n=1 Tax=Microbacterium resistens TaxID=156977 RepID=UPI0012FB5592|nr:hypothetical protein [Microbacterium resistens]
MPHADRPSTDVPRLAVQVTHRPPAPVLRYIDQVVGSQSDIEFRCSRGVLTRFDVDVLHVADAALDSLLGARGTGGLQRLLSTLALIRNLRRHRIALVRMIHRSDKSPGPRRADMLARRLLDRATSRFVVTDDATPTPDPARTTVIPHPHYRDRFLGFPRGELTPGRVLCVSPGHLPDSVRSVLGAARVAQTPGVELRLAGLLSSELEAHVRSALARRSPTLSTRVELLSDGAQVQEIQAAELVAVPRVETYEDEQRVFLALSLDRPVIVPLNDTTAALTRTVGPGWVHLSEGPITAASLDAAFASLRRDRRTTGPDLEGRDLAVVHSAYADVFASAALSLRSQEEAVLHSMGEGSRSGKKLEKDAS